MSSQERHTQTALTPPSSDGDTRTLGGACQGHSPESWCPEFSLGVGHVDMSDHPRGGLRGQADTTWPRPHLVGCRWSREAETLLSDRAVQALEVTSLEPWAEVSSLGTILSSLQRTEAGREGAVGGLDPVNLLTHWPAECLDCMMSPRVRACSMGL